MASSHHPRRPRDASGSQLPIGRYTRLDEIGRGSFATVYQGVHTVSSLPFQLPCVCHTDVPDPYQQKSRTYVAIKSVNLSKLNKKLKENLSSEIQILKGLYHPHIVALIDCHETTSHIHLIMEYCALGDLSMFIKRRDTLGEHRYTRDMMAKYPNPRGGALNEVIVRHFLKQLSSALKFLRDRNLIHRDIKPQNLLLCPAPASYRAGLAQVVPFKGSEDSFSPRTGLESLPMLKIADFGFARSLPATSLAETLCGSPLYMAPEILRYEKYDAKADLWSVGAVLYEMVVGRPPFRATNHVELLRKIEKGEDKIRFPEDNPASDEIKKLIRILLKRNPVERMAFTEFFDSNIIKGDIPGLVRDDNPSERRRSSVEADVAPPMSRPPSHGTPIESKREKEATKREEPFERLATQQPMTPRQKSGTPPGVTPMRRGGSADRPPSSVVKEPSRAMTPPQRPSVVPHATAPGRQELMDRNATAMDRQKDRTLTGHPQIEKQAPNTREERERAAQEVAFERDYVVLDRDAVVVNALADEIDHSPRIQGNFPRSMHHAMSRRVTASGAPTATPSSPQTPTGKAMQVVSGRPRADSGDSRQSSYERRYGQSPTSATSAISKALNMASGRLFGMGFSPPMAVTKGGRSPPLGYNPFPAYPSNQGNMMLVGDGGKTHMAMDEDTKSVQMIEECATRSDVVYGFAEVKYKQLIPLAPSAETPNMPDIEHDSGDFADSGLTVDAIVTLSEEALVLYVKALSLLAKSMDIAGAWWTRKNRADPFGDSAGNRVDPASTVVGTRINHVVQWVRNRFNEVLEKAEFVRLKLIEGQKRLSGHPSNQNNQSITSSDGSSVSGDVMVSSGVTAEKLMYDRALEMSRAAAINELTGEDLPGCEIAYVTAVRMLEAILEDDRPTTSQGQKDDEKVVLDEVQAEDRQVVVKCKFPSDDYLLSLKPSNTLDIVVSSIRGRLAALRKKLTLMAKRTQTMPPPPPPSSNMAASPATVEATPPK